MSFLSENVIPGNHGKTFGTNAKSGMELQRIMLSLIRLKGIKDIVVNTEIFPREITVRTTAIVEVREIQNLIKSLGYHAIPKSMFHF
ncbi:heavy-metal-associated domain-containing protein [Paracrocinitomix mangrovi]|uniref:heavy-metal-associated domain-containing protein n=1 Tax=Paracrocinitomix mangrovi TaxID=2862509 RepID=UPI001C8DF093|nr:heavy-metal-associated domain-containing protein [Paracrocinitomix mangrovi]UKN00284.1 heavy-metal-associated domain-containing protein [Paracrocinitomix mangrovi]